MHKSDSAETAILQVYWSRKWGGIFLIMAIFGIAGVGMYVFNEIRGLKQPMPIQQMAVLCAFAPFGVGFFIATLQRVSVYPDRIENHHLIIHRILDFSTTQIAKMDTNGYQLKDGKGTKIFIHKYMENGQELLQWINQRNAA